MWRVKLTVDVDGGEFIAGDLMPFSYSRSSTWAWTFRPVVVVVAAIRLMMTSWLMRSLPRQLVEMKLGSRCSIWFYFDVAGREVADLDL